MIEEEHICDDHTLNRLKLLYSRRGYDGYESCGIYKCKICGKLWKIRHQFDDGTGDDDIWIAEGGSVRGYTFTHEEAESVLVENE